MLPLWSLISDPDVSFTPAQGDRTLMYFILKPNPALRVEMPRPALSYSSWKRRESEWDDSAYPNPASCVPGRLRDSSPHAVKKSGLIPVGSQSKQRTMLLDFLWELQVWPEDLSILKIDNVSRLRYGVSF